MQLKDTDSRFGSIAQFFHWIIALLVLTQYYLVYWTEWVLPKKSPQAIFYISGLHKPIGVLLLLLIFLAFCWRISNSRPTFPSTMANWEKIAAHLNSPAVSTLCTSHGHERADYVHCSRLSTQLFRIVPNSYFYKR